MTSQDFRSHAPPTENSGSPLQTTDRAAMEARFGVDFGRVRIHADAEAAQDARQLRAQAFNWGSHLYFGAGRYRPGSARTRQLLTHELVHVVQQGAHDSGTAAADVLFRADETEAVEEASAETETGSGAESALEASEAASEPELMEPVPQLIVSFATETHKKSRYTNVNPGQDVELGDALPGDVLTLSAIDKNRKKATGPLHWDIPRGMEEIQRISTHGIQMRVTGSAHTRDKPHTVEIGLEGLSGEKVAIRLQIVSLPDRPQAIEPELLANAEEREKLREERKAIRRPFSALPRKERKVARKAAREAFKALPREERQTQRETRRHQLKALRQKARPLRRKKRALEKKSTFRLDTQRRIDRAMLRAVEVTKKALVRLRAGADDPQVWTALQAAMRWSNSTATEADRKIHLARIIDTLTVARNSMLLVTHESFNIGSGCDEKTGAYVNPSSDRGGTVFLCPLWTRGTTGLKFGCAGHGLDETRAYALLHEFIHLAGPSASNEKYVDDGTWQGLKLEETLNMADGYACLAWKLAQGAGP